MRPCGRWRSTARPTARTSSTQWTGVEVGAINGVNPRTAEALVEMGLGEIVNLHGNNGFIFLGKYQPYD